MADDADLDRASRIADEGDVADASFYKEEILESRLAAMLEAIDVKRAQAS